MKKRNIVNYASYGGAGLHPKIRLEGKYLAQFGFKIGDSIETSVEENRIVIRRLSNENGIPLPTQVTNQTTKPMEPQNEKPAKPISTLFLIEKGTWRKGEEVITVTSRPEGQRHRAVAHIYAEYDAQGYVSFFTKDREGNEILPPTPNRFELKKQLLANEQMLIERQSQQQAQPTAEQSAARAQTTTPQTPTEALEHKAKKPRVPGKSRRKDELTQTRNAQTGPENEQTQNQ